MKRACALALLIALAGCGAPAAPSFVPPAATGDARPSAACPPPGKIVRQHKAAAKIVTATAFTGGSVTPTWTIVFSGLTAAQAAAVPDFTPRAAGACGVAAKPAGKITNGGSYHRSSSCTNGACTVTEKIAVRYEAPAKISTAPWRYDTIKFGPVQPKSGYTVLLGALVQIKRFP